MTTPEEYAQQKTAALSPLLQEVLDFTLQHHPLSHMVSGHVQGQFLRLLSLAAAPKRILEIGTFTGFSALCLAEGLSPDGLLYTLELREADANTARGYFERSQYGALIRSLVGNAADIIPTLNEVWDIVFIDADKTGYIGYYEQVVPQLKPGGIILADNVLFHGEVLADAVTGKNAMAMANFSNHVAADTRVDQVLLTIRDGLMMIRKKP